MLRGMYHKVPGQLLQCWVCHHGSLILSQHRYILCVYDVGMWSGNGLLSCVIMTLRDLCAICVCTCISANVEMSWICLWVHMRVSPQLYTVGITVSSPLDTHRVCVCVCVRLWTAVVCWHCDNCDASFVKEQHLLYLVTVTLSLIAE